MTHSLVTRRGLLSATATLGAAAVTGGVEARARTISGEMPWAPGEANAPHPAPAGGYQFFTPTEAAFIEAAVSRLIPNDELGPGAKEAGVAIFLDRQLGGAYGSAETWYMQGPWADGTEQQGYQTRLTPAQVYRAAIKALDGYCRERFQNRTFAQLPPQDQDSILERLEQKKINLSSVKAEIFFDLLHQNTIEGFFSDPIHGGNRDMVGWKLIGFPGARYDYRPYVDKYNQRLNLAPVSIMGRPGWIPKS